MPTNDKNEALNESMAGSAEEARRVGRQLNAQKKKFLTIHSGQNGDDTAPVMVSVNGYTYQIRRDEEVEVPESVINVLALAVQQQPKQDVVDGQLRTTFRSVNRFSFSVRDSKAGA